MGGGGGGGVGGLVMVGGGGVVWDISNEQLRFYLHPGPANVIQATTSSGSHSLVPWV